MYTNDRYVCLYTYIYIYILYMYIYIHIYIYIYICLMCIYIIYIITGLTYLIELQSPHVVILPNTERYRFNKHAKFIFIESLKALKNQKKPYGNF